MGAFNYCRWLALNGVDAQFKVTSIQLLKSSNFPKIVRWVSELPNDLFFQFKQLFPTQYPVVYTMVFGGRNKFIDSKDVSLLSDLGLIHLLVVSGSQMSLLSLGMLMIGRILRVPIICRFVCIIFIQLLYVLVVGIDASILRSMLMVDLFIFHRYILLYRYHLWWYVMISVSIICLLLPGAMFQSGFWYSFLITVALIVIVPKVTQQLPRPTWFFTYLIVSLVAVVTSFVVQLIVEGRINMMSIPSNLWMGWCASMVLIVGLFGWLLNFIFPIGAQIISLGIDWMIRVLMISLQQLSEFHFWIGLTRQERWFLMAGLGFILILYSVREFTGQMPMLPKFIRWINLKFRWLIVLGLGCIIFGWILLPERFRLVAIDVGQGDATLVMQGRRAILIDVGGVINKVPIAERTIVPVLAYYGISYLEKIIITHHDLDHIGGLSYIIKHVRYGQLISPTPLNLKKHTQLIGNNVTYLGNTRITLPYWYHERSYA